MDQNNHTYKGPDASSCHFLPCPVPVGLATVMFLLSLVLHPVIRVLVLFDNWWWAARLCVTADISHDDRKSSCNFWAQKKNTTIKARVYEAGGLGETGGWLGTWGGWQEGGAP